MPPKATTLTNWSMQKATSITNISSCCARHTRMSLVTCHYFVGVWPRRKRTEPLWQKLCISVRPEGRMNSNHDPSVQGDAHTMLPGLNDHRFKGPSPTAMPGKYGSCRRTGADMSPLNVFFWSWGAHNPGNKNTRVQEEIDVVFNFSMSREATEIL